MSLAVTPPLLVCMLKWMNSSYDEAILAKEIAGMSLLAFLFFAGAIMDMVDTGTLFLWL